MKKPHLFFLAGFLLLVAVVGWLTLGAYRISKSHPVSPDRAPGGISAGPANNYGAVPVTNIVGGSPAYSSPQSSADLPAEREKVQFYKNAQMLEERATPSDAEGRFTKKRLIRATGKYPFLLTEENWQRNSAGKDELIDEKTMVGDHFVVKLTDARAVGALQTVVAGFGGSILRAIPNSDLYLVKTPAVSLNAYELTRKKLSEAGAVVKYAEPDYVVHALMTPNDPSFGSLWGMNNVGQTGGAGDADIDAPEAWDVSRGNSSVIVGIIDTGIDYKHPDLAANCWVNLAEIAGNGIDDDHNGYVDDMRGWDFANDDNDPMDDHYHGTHCAGTIGAVGNNGIGVAGVCHNVRLMALKFLSSAGGGYTSDAVEAVSYATANGAILTSNSWGGGGYSQALKDAIDSAGAAGKLFIAAAGNSSQNTDVVSNYPSCYNSQNIISVAATDHNDALASFSNYGVNTVHLGAPGVSIFSTSPQSGYRTLSGTSMACPHVAGACALIKSARPEMNWSDIKNAILSNTDGVASLAAKTKTGGRLNIARALLVSSGPYVTITGMQVLEPSGNGVINPGETVSLPITIKNVGSNPATGLTTTASLTVGASSVMVVQGTKNWGELAVGASANNATSPFKIAVGAGIATPYRFTIRFTTVDTQGHSWASETEFTAYTSAIVSGKVTALADGAGIAGATVIYDGPLKGSVLTDASGNYNVSVVDGIYSFAASGAGFNPAAAVSVTAPPNRDGLNFILGRSKLQISPTSLSATQFEDQITQQTVTVTNAGNQPLTVGIGKTSGATSLDLLTIPRTEPDPVSKLGSPDAAERGVLPISDVSGLDAGATLPFTEDFESNTIAAWTVNSGSGTRENTNATAATGTKSFHQVYTGPNAHFNGINRQFAANMRPKSVSFWVRAESAGNAAGYCVLSGASSDFIWFYAREDGRFYVNGDLNGGDISFQYQPKVWYRVEFRNVDWTAKTFAYYVDGGLVKSGVPFRNSAATTSLARLDLYNFSTNSEAWWDDVRISDTSVNWLSYSPTQFTVAPGQSTSIQVTFNSTDLAAGSYTASLDLVSNDPVNPTTGIPISLKVNAAPNTPPVANNQTVTTLEDTGVTITLTGSDAESNPLSASITTLPTNGILYQTSDGVSLGAPITAVPAVVSHPQWKVIYLPGPNANGPSLGTFQFQLKDKRSISNSGTITVTVTPVNDVPVAQNDYASALPGQTPITIPVLANDSDADGQALTVTSVTQGSKGSVTISPNGTLAYIPKATFVLGADTFSYTISDGTGGTSSATVTISIGYLSAGAWPTLGNGPEHTGYYPASLGGSTFTPNWTLTFDRPLNQAAIADGKVFVTRDIYFQAATLTAVDLPTGTISWVKELPSARSTTPPSYYQGQILFQRGNHASDSQLWNVSAADGSTIWNKPFAAQWEVYQAPAVTTSSVFINGGSYGGMYGFNRMDGTQLFFHQLPQVDRWTPTVGGAAIYSCINGILISHNPATGVRNWTYTINTSLYGATVPAYSGGRIYVGSSTGLYAVNVGTTSATAAWTVSGNFTGYPAVGNGSIFAIPATGFKVQQFNAATGAVIGDFLTGTENCTTQPIATNDSLIVASSNKTFIFRLSDRTLLQTINFGGNISISNGTLIIAGLDNILRSYIINGSGNSSPVATAQTITGTEDNPVTISLAGTDADGDLLTAIIDSLPSRGTLFQTSDGQQVGAPITKVPVLVTNPARKIIYRPPPDAFGNPLTNFNFRVNDGSTNSVSTAITINVNNVNDAPIAVDDQFYLRAGNVLPAFWPTANDVDADGEQLTLVSFNQPAHGTLSKNTDGSLRYTPAEGFIEGSDTFRYTLKDSGNLTSSANVTITLSEAFGREWPTLGNGPDHLGRYPGSLGTTPLTERWQVATGTSVNSLAVAEGKVFYTGKYAIGGYMYAVALDMVTGGEKWRKQLPAANTLNPPSFYKGKIYFQRGNHSSDSQLFSLDANTAETIWQAPFQAQWESYLAPAVNQQGVFVDGGSYGGIYGFDPTSGTQKFFTGLEQYDGWTPTLYGNGVYSFVSGIFRSHDPSTGAILWSVDLGWDWRGWTMDRTVAMEGGLALLTNNKAGGNELVCIDLASRAVVWRVQAAFTGTPVMAGGIVYALSGGVVKTYGLSTGLWLGDFTAPNETYLTNSPVVAGDVLIAASSSKTYFFNLSTRQVFQTLAFGSQPAVVDDAIYLACSDNTVRAYGRSPVGNLPPVARPAKVSIVEEAQSSIQLEATDVNRDAIYFVIRSLPLSGTLYQSLDGTSKGVAITTVPTLVSNPAGMVVYQGAQDINGSGVGNFDFTAHDPYSASAPATVQISISPINDAPTAVPDVVAIRPGQILSNFRPETNDRDVDGDVLTVINFTQPSKGQLSQAGDKSLQYTPGSNFTTGSDTFNYTISDTSGIQATASVTINVSNTLGREWPTFGAGPDHTGYLPIELGTSLFTQRWSNNLGKVPTQAAIVGGKVYTTLKVYFQDSSLVALDGSSGGELWRANFPYIAYSNPPSVFGDDVFTQISNSSNSKLYAINAATGTQHWSSPFGAQWEQYLAPAVDATGVYVDGGGYGGLYGYIPTTGVQKFFNSSLDQFDQWTPTLYGSGLYSFMTGKFRSHDKSTGAILWSLDFGWNWGGYSMNRTVACANDRAYLVNDSVTIPSGDQELISVDLIAKSIAWRVKGKFNGTPAVAHQSAFVFSQGNIKAFDVSTGAYLGNYAAPGETSFVSQQPIVTNDSIIACTDAKTYIFDLRTHTLRQTLNYGGLASLAGESLYLASSDNFLRAFAVPDALNTPPLVQNVALTLPEDTSRTVTLAGTDADNDPLSFVIASLPAAGKLYQTTDGVTLGAQIVNTPAIVANPLGKVIYVPPQDRNGTGFGDFTYAASDGKSTSTARNVTLAVTPVNDAPLAFADEREIEPGQILSPIRETLNDYDVDGDVLTVVSFTQPPQGRVVRNTDGTLRYHPPAGATNGSEQFSYTIQDTSGVASTATVTVSIVNSVNGYWPTFGNGPSHTGFTSAVVSSSDWQQKWTIEVGNNARQPAIAEGKVFISSNSGVPTITAINEKTGASVWQRTFPSAFSFNPPSYDNGRIYVQRGNHSSDTQLIALNATDGTTVWSSPHAAQWENYYAPAIDSTGVYVDGGSYGGLYGFAPATGVQKFFQNLDQFSQWTPAIYGDGLYTFVTGKLRSHQKSTGAMLWTLDLGWEWSGYDMNRTIACNGNTAYLVNNSPSQAYSDEDLVAVNLDTHTPSWSVNGQFTGTPAINNGLVYVLSENSVQARRASDGYLIATFIAPLGEFLIGQPILTSDLVIATSSQKTYVFGRYDQVLRKIFNIGGTISVAGNQLIIATDSGTVSAFAAAPALVFSPPGGNFDQSINVILSTSQPNSTIYYTLDGTAPDLTSPTIVSGGSIQITSSRKIRAIVVNGSAVSRIYEAAFVLNSPLDSWRQTFFGTTVSSDSLLDPDHDSLVNLLEFAFGTNPTIGKNGALRYNGTLAGGGTLVENGQPITMASGSTYYAVFIRRKDYITAGLTYFPEFTSDLSTWQTSAIVPTVLADNGVYQVVSVPFPALVTGKKAGVFRIRMTLQP